MCIEQEVSFTRGTEEKIKKDILDCPICHKQMTLSYHGAYFCDDNVNTEQNFMHKVVVLCKCGRRMQPNAT